MSSALMNLGRVVKLCKSPSLQLAMSNSATQSRSPEWSLFQSRSAPVFLSRSVTLNMSRNVALTMNRNAIHGMSRNVTMNRNL